MSVKIKSLELKSFKCFEDFSIDCTRADGSVYQWTVLLGNNNTGKTNLLKVAAGLFKLKLRCLDLSFRLIDELLSLGLLRMQTSLGLEKDVSWDFYPHTHIELSNPTEYPLIFGYGVSRYPSNGGFSDSQVEDCETLFFRESRLLNLEEWLMNLDYVRSKGGEQSSRAARLLEQIGALILGRVLPEVLDFRARTSDTLSNYLEFKTIDGWFRYNELGYGYQSMLSWVIDLCKRMFDRYEELDNPLSGEAVVLVDEIDLHLHPQWQREVIQRLSDVFPNTQFIVTTHSPLVLQSMSDVNLYTLTRREQKVSVERHSRNSFVGWTVEEILGEVMHLEEDVHSDTYQRQMALFDEGLDEQNLAKAKAAYDELMKILHPNNPVRRMLEFQLPKA